MAAKTPKQKTLAEKYNEILSKKENFQITPHKVNEVGPMWFIVIMFSTFYFGQFYVTPVVNESYELSSFIQCVLYGISYWSFTQMVINWYCIRNVKSMFKTTTKAVERNDHLTMINERPEDELVTKGDANEAPEFRHGKREISVHKQDTNGVTHTESLVWKRHKEDGQIYAIKMPTSGDTNGQVVMYPYWSWKPCLSCQHSRPPRVHHCPLCKSCILKRDHHCYFTGRCIGLNNQRHFIVFSFWAAIACTLSIVYTVFYSYIMICRLGRLSWLDIFLPATLMRWLMGYTELYHVILYFVAYNLCFFMILTSRYVMINLMYIKNGITSFECNVNIKIKNMNSFYQELTAVFGEHWYMNFIFPCHGIYPVKQDAVDWPNIKQ